MKTHNKITILLLSFILITLNGCKGIRDNLSLKKKQNTDEFLVQKKNPLILPPDYQKLPKPSNINKRKKEDEKEIDLSKVFSNSEEISSENTSDINKSLEDSIRKKIGNN
tara:strand:- start:2395 stop:2724 length:330 start_codon:yes stop_codon:yes gene_type:complete